MGIIQSFEELDVWKLGREIRKQCYGLASSLPAHERHNLADQIRSAAISITANLAEGYGRFHFTEHAQFCRLARSSACELLDHLIACNDAGYLNNLEFQELRQELSTFLKLLNGYI